MNHFFFLLLCYECRLLAKVGAPHFLFLCFSSLYVVPCQTSNALRLAMFLMIFFLTHLLLCCECRLPAKVGTSATVF